MNRPSETAIEEAIELRERALAASSAARWAEAEEMAGQAPAIVEREDGPNSPAVANLSRGGYSLCLKRRLGQATRGLRPRGDFRKN